MAHVKKIVTYDLPDEFEQAVPTKALGKTSTQSYDGPSTLILWIDRESKRIEQTWDKDDYTERPVPLNLEAKELKADTDENTIKIGMLLVALERENFMKLELVLQKMTMRSQQTRLTLD